MSEETDEDWWEYAEADEDEELESELLELDMPAGLLDILLRDRTTGGHILWATDEYADRGEAFAPECGMTVRTVAGRGSVRVLPHVVRRVEARCAGTYEPAEAFPTARLCNVAANRCDEEWFGRKDVFNTTFPDNSWQTVTGGILFPPGRTWQDYVGRTCLEKDCGEAPHLVSRYDVVTGDCFRVENRVGLLDRKLRIIGERTRTEACWFRHVLRAYMSTYGYERKGRNLLLARENLLWTFDDYYLARWQDFPPEALRRRIAEIISWNIWQMDGRTGSVPSDKSPTPCKVRLWRLRKNFHLKELEETPSLWFDVVVGNGGFCVNLRCG